MTDRDKRIDAETKRLIKVVLTLSPDKKAMTERLIKRASFLLVLTEDLEVELKSRDQYLETTVNASQRFVKPNPLLREYRDTVKSYQTVIKQLIDLTKGEETTKDTKDELEKFLGK